MDMRHSIKIKDWWITNNLRLSIFHPNAIENEIDECGKTPTLSEPNSASTSLYATNHKLLRCSVSNLWLFCSSSTMDCGIELTGNILRPVPS